MLQYKIPQDVQIEDRITSFLTMRQLIICAVGGGIAYFFYIALSSVFYAEVWFPPVFLLSAITIAIAFVKINGIRFTKWSLLLFEFLTVPRKRVWDKRATCDILFSYVGSRVGSQNQNNKKQKEQERLEPKKKHLSSLEELSIKLDQNPFEHIEQKKDHTDETSDHDLTAAILHNKEEKQRQEERLTQNIEQRNSMPAEQAIEKQEKPKQESKSIEELINVAIPTSHKRSTPVREKKIDTNQTPTIPDHHKDILKNLSDDKNE